MAPPSFEQAAQLYSSGKRDAARKVCFEILQQDKNHVRALQLLSIIAADSQRLDRAIELMRRAITLSPDNAERHKNLGVLYQRAGATQPAIDSFRKAIQLNPNRADAYFELGTALIELGQMDAAIEAYRHVSRLEPDNTLVHFNVGFAQAKRNQLDLAIDSYEKVLAIEPQHALAMARLGESHQLLGDMPRAESYFANAIANGAGDATKIQAKILLPPIYESQAQLQKVRQRFLEGLNELETESLSIRAPVMEQAGIPFLLPYQGYNDRTPLMQLGNIYRKAWPVQQPQLQGAPDGKLRVGFVSSFFRDHTIGRITKGFVKHLDRDDFHVSVISIGQHTGDVANFIRQHADQHVAVRANLQEVANTILALQLDALIYPEIGMEHTTYFLAFLRLAPVQCVTWGHPQTTGIDTIDYYLSWRGFEPDDAQSQYSERLVCLETIPAYYDRPTPSTGEQDRAHFGLSDADHIYYCPQTLFKFHPEFDTAMAGILRKDGHGKILIPAAKRTKWNELLNQRFAVTMPDVSNRIVMVPRLSRDEFMNLATYSDVILDTFPFGGGTTSLEVFATGTPIVTRSTELMRGRFTTAYYNEMGCSQLVAQSTEQFVDLAVRLATNDEFQTDMRKSISTRSEVLYERREAVRQLEQFLQSVCKK